jgi:Sulfatase
MRTALTLLLGCLGTAHVLAAEPAPAPSATIQVDGRTPAEYGPPSWPAQATPPATAPNVLVILTDDVGFGASSTFGGPVPTPTFDALAARGLRYTWFHTAAICSPTRAALLTGRTPQNVGVGNTTNLATGYPGYTSVIPKSAATVAQILQAAGYATAMFGKGHITPEWEMSQAGPFDRWPTGLGFQYFYGFLGADTSMFAPWVVENTTHVDAARGRTDYDFDADIADKAIGWIGNQHMLAPQHGWQSFAANLTRAGTKCARPPLRDSSTSALFLLMPRSHRDLQGCRPGRHCRPNGGVSTRNSWKPMPLPCRSPMRRSGA